MCQLRKPLHEYVRLFRKCNISKFFVTKFAPDDDYKDCYQYLFVLKNSKPVHKLCFS